MNTLSTRPLFHRLLFRLSLSTTASPSPASSPSYHSQRRSDEESRAVRVSVWWDFENCSLPSGVNVFKVAHCITSAVRVSGIKGPVQITAFGDISQLARTNQEALTSTGVTLTHVPSGGKNSADRSLLLDLMYWVSHNPPPAHLFLISGDRDFAGILHRLRMSNYNILLACPDNSSPTVLCSAASIMWHWNALIKGKSFAGKHFNQPPDGPFNSWYGHYKGILEDPYAVVVEPPPLSVINHTSDFELVLGTEVVPEQHLRPVPRDVLRKMRKIVNSHPKGISFTVLRSNLFSGEVRMDKKFYGHKSFSRFLLSKPNLFEIKRSNGRFLVFPASCQASKPVECSIKSESRDSSVVAKQKVEPNSQDTVPAESKSDGEDHDFAASSVSKARANSVTLNEKSPLSASCKMDEEQKKSGIIYDKNETCAEEVKGNKSAMEELQNSEAFVSREIGEHCFPVENHNSEAEMGYFRQIWNHWFTKKDMGIKEMTDRASDEVQASVSEPSNFVGSHGTPDSSQSSDNKVTTDAKLDAKAIGHGEKSDHCPSLLAKILSWFKLPRKDTDFNISNEPIRKSNQMEKSKRDELFLMDSFWSDIESFLNTYKGSKIIWNSKTRREIAHSLQKEGPLVIQPLEHNDVLHLIDLLILEKKWIKELPVSTYPFRVIKSTRGNAESAQSNNSGRLRSIISSQSEKLLDQEEKVKVSFDTRAKPCWKSKDEVLSDCKKLLDEMFAESPEAINIGRFKVKFVERYGYVLDYKKLGYPKLISLLQTLPDLKVGLNFVYCTVPKEEFTHIEDEIENAVAGKSNDENDSPWEELGPVDEDLICKKTATGKYESPLSEDDMSDSEEDEDEESKRSTNNDDSSLLQILNSWHNVGNGKKEDGFGSNTVELGVADNNKLRPAKSYCFVADAEESGNKDRLIDGILANLQKSGQQKTPTQLSQ